MSCSETKQCFSLIIFNKTKTFFSPSFWFHVFGSKTIRPTGTWPTLNTALIRSTVNRSFLSAKMSVGQKVFGQSTHNRLFSTHCVIDLLTDQLRLFLFDFFFAQNVGLGAGTINNVTLLTSRVVS